MASSIGDEILALIKPVGENYLAATEEDKLKFYGEDCIFHFSGGDVYGPGKEGVKQYIKRVSDSLTKSGGVRLHFVDDEFEATQMGENFAMYTCLWEGYDKDNKKVSFLRVLAVLKKTGSRWQMYRASVIDN